MACGICRLEGHNRTTCPQKDVPAGQRVIAPLRIRPEGFSSWYVEYDYDEEHDCAGYGCDDYCRCGVITGGRVTEVRSGSMASSRSFLNRLPQSAEERFVLRILFQSLGADDFEVYGENDYYGQVAQVRMQTSAENLFTKFNEEKTLLGKLGVALNNEYGFLPPWWSEVQDLKVKEVDPSAIQLSNPRLNREVMRRYRDEAFRYVEGADLVGVTVRQTPQGYKVVDGNHRVQTAVSLGMETLEVLVLCVHVEVRDLLEEMRQSYYQFTYAISSALEDVTTKPLALDYLQEAQKSLSELERLAEEL